MLKAVLFDFDGTLMDSIDSVMATFAKTAEALQVEFSMEEARAQIGKPLITTGDVLIGPGWGQRFLDEYCLHYPACCEGNIRFYPQVEDMLRALQAQNITVCVVTSKRRDSALMNLDMAGGRALIDVLVPLEEHPKPKPGPEPVLFALQKLGIRAEDTVMVGDACYDILSGNSAGVRTIAVTWGAGTRESLQEAQPTYTVETVADLSELLKTLINA